MVVFYKLIVCGGVEELFIELNLDDYVSEDNSDVVMFLNSIVVFVGYCEINSYIFIYFSIFVFVVFDVVWNIYVEKLDVDFVCL